MPPQESFVLHFFCSTRTVLLVFTTCLCHNPFFVISIAKYNPTIMYVVRKRIPFISAWKPVSVKYGLTYFVNSLAVYLTSSHSISVCKNTATALSSYGWSGSCWRSTYTDPLFFSSIQVLALTPSVYLSSSMSQELFSGNNI